MKSNFIKFSFILLILLFSHHNQARINSNEAKFEKKKKVNNLFSPEEIKEYDDKISSILKKYRFNGNILISRDNNIIYKKSFGYSNVLTKELLDTNSTFQLASVSKQFTAMSVMMLKERGKLNLEDTVKNILPGFPYKDITVKHLLNHTSGLPNYIWIMEKYWKKETLPSNNDVLSMIIEHPLPLYFRPGTRFNYSNTGYCFLALIVEKVSGIPFADFLKQNIFDKLNMNNTFAYSQTDLLKNSKRTYGFVHGRRSFRMVSEDKLNMVLGDKGIYSTIDDLYKWDQALYENSLLKEETIQTAFEQTILKNKRKINYGFGFRLAQYKDKKIIYHNGWWQGYKASFMRFVDDKTTIIILNNTDSHLARIVDELEKLLYG